MNRQQRKANERKKDKEITKKLINKAMSAYKVTNDKRYVDIAEATKWIDHLEPKHQKIIKLIIEYSSNADLYTYSRTIETVLRNWLYEHNFDVEKELNNINDLLKIEDKYIKKYDEENKEGSYFMNLDKDRENIINDYKKMKEENMKENQILDNLCIKYFKISKTSIKGVITDFKKNNKNVQKDVQAEPDLEAITDYIFEDGENPLKEKTVKANNTTPKNKNTKLKVKSIVVEDEEGREYIKENGVVTVGKEKFNNVDELEKYKSNELSEYKKEYEEKIAEINKAYEDEKIKFLKKINNIADVFMM